MHSCPDCDSPCRCGGDIDDVDIGDEEAIQGCTHCSDLPVDDEDCWPEDFDDEEY